MSDNEIKKALECCSKGNQCKSDCPYDNEDDSCIECTSLLTKYALDLINRQQAEIERLNKARQRQAQFLGEERGQKYELLNKIGTAKTEAIKEVLSVLETTIEESDKYIREYEDSKEQRAYNKALRDVYNLVKEMTGCPTKIEHSSLCETDTYKGGITIVGKPEKLLKKEYQELRTKVQKPMK